MVKQDGCYIVVVFNFIGFYVFYGCYWGCLVDYFFLYFEFCYYQVIDVVIVLKLDCVEVGVQGEYKLVCGYLFLFVYFVYYIVDDGFCGVVFDFLDQECLAVLYDIELQCQESLFKVGEFKQEMYDEY